MLTYYGTEVSAGAKNVIRQDSNTIFAGYFITFGGCWEAQVRSRNIAVSKLLRSNNFVFSGIGTKSFYSSTSLIIAQPNFDDYIYIYISTYVRFRF